MKIIKNPNEEQYLEATRAVENNNGYCPCQLLKNDDTVCMCKNFVLSKELGLCECGRYLKMEE